MFNVRARLLVWHFVQNLKTFDQVALTKFHHRHICGGMAVYAGARLLHGFLSFRVDLVYEHEGVTTLFPEVARKRVASPHCLAK